MNNLKLEWQSDQRTVKFDTTMLFGHGYDFEGLECLFRETVGLDFNFIIWPDHLYKSTWNLYGGSDGWFQRDIATEQQAKMEVYKILKSLNK